MLTGLRICNFAVIDEVDISFGPGLTVLTGETGAGKSILVDALGLLLGGRADPEVVRAGAEEAVVEGSFVRDDVLRQRLETQGLPDLGEELSLRRVVGRSGRSKVYVNGALVTVGVLSQLMRGRVDLAGQHEHMTLFDSERHLGLLDEAAGLGPSLTRYQEAFAQVRAIEAELETLGGDERRLLERGEFVRFQLEELRKFGPVEGEDRRLEDEKRRLVGAERLSGAASQAEGWLVGQDGAAVEKVSRARALVAEAGKLDSGLGPLQERLSAAVAELEDVARELGRYAGGVESDPHRLADLDERLDTLRRLCRKHGTDSAGLVARQRELEAELAKLENRGEELARLLALRETAHAQAFRLAEGLSAERRDAAGRFASRVVEGLGLLCMGKAAFEVRVTPTSQLAPHGLDEVELYFSANVGEPLRPLAKVASGGEASRVLLALRRALSAVDAGGCYVLDEADSGVSGAVAEVVGRMIQEVSVHRQVLCITHLAQVAAYADTHLCIRKSVEQGRTVSRVLPLGAAEERTREIARMLSGLQVTREALGAAQALVRSALRSSRPKARGRVPRRPRNPSLPSNAASRSIPTC